MTPLLLLLAIAAQVAEPPAPIERVPVESEVPPTPEPERTRERVPTPEPDGLDEPVVAALQLGAACGTYVVTLPTLLFSSYACPLLGCGMCLVPAAVGYAGTWVGDRFGNSRAPAIWPILAAYAGLLVTVVSVGVLYYGIFANATPVLMIGATGGMLAGFGASVIGVPVAYALSAEEKLPGDDGTDLPAIFEAAHQAAPAKKHKAPVGKRPAPEPERPPPLPMPELPTPPMLEPLGARSIMRF